LAFAHSGGAVFAAPGSSPTYGCNDVFANAGGDSLSGGINEGTNFSADPMFCDAQSEDFSLHPSSPCLSAGECGLVGALGVGPCSANSVSVVLKTASWGSLKSHYR
jgi:hypothetical protein